MGVNNVVALSKSSISKEQFDLLLSLQCDIVLALDKDVEKTELIKELEQFGNMCNKYIVYDENGLLEDKDSPFDKGIEVWNNLYKSKIKV